MKPGGAFGSAPAGLATIADGEAVGGLAKGLGMSAGEMRRTIPGESVRQSPNAASPVRTWAATALARTAPMIRPVAARVSRGVIDAS